jgi:DNA polymerase III subunit alpha
MNPTFAHLHVHSEYSLSSATIRIPELIAKVKEHGQSAVALTDLSNMFAVVKFYRAALSHGIKPILGAEINIQDGSHRYPVVMLAQHQQGYKNLKILLSRAYLEGQRQGVPYCNIDWLNDLHDGLIVLLGGQNSIIAQTFHDKATPEQLNQVIHNMAALFPSRLYLEVCRNGYEHEQAILTQTLALAETYDLPIVATNNVYFLNRDDYQVHEARVCIHEGLILGDKKIAARFTEEQYLCATDTMAEKFADLPEALHNTTEIIKRCTVEIELGHSYLPDFPIPDTDTPASYLATLSRQGLAQRLLTLFPDADTRHTKEAEYYQRLDIELEVIANMGFPGYFLIVADFVRWAKEQDIPVGPGRGSGAGSLVAYALQITELDPLEYGLLFERFLNPERISMPDFDIDFCMEGRDRVIDYVAETYGTNQVSQIITFGSMNAKAVVRDAGRVLGRPYGMVDSIAKLIPFDLKMTLTKALQESPELKARYDTEDEVRDIIDLAQSLEGLKRNAGRHAGGVVIAPSDLADFTPIYCEENATTRASQLDKDDVEAVGLVKFDFLGLRTLTIIKQALANIGDPDIDIEQIPLDDAKVYQLLQSGQTSAVFQLESRGMRELIVRLKPSRFEDIIALVALFRPGPLGSGMVDDFVAIKHGQQKASYPHPDLIPILEPTYGIIVYQEQVMQIAQVLAGYSLGEADLLRRAMGKKKPEEMAKQRVRFMEGAKEKQVDETIASDIFSLMEKFAEYGFNKSHSAAYALVSYQTAWLKSYYPAEFMASVLTYDMAQTEKIVTLIDEIKDMGIAVLAPDINHSHYQFSVTEDGNILYGLGAVKGIGAAAIENMIHARNNGGLFRDFRDFCCRIDLGKIHVRVMEILIRIGALDNLIPPITNTPAWEGRATLLANAPDAIAYAGQRHHRQSSGQTDLFGFDNEEDEEHDQAPELSPVPPWSEHERLYGERASLGLFLTGHPINHYLPELRSFIQNSIADINRGGITCRVAGLITAIGGNPKRKISNVQLDDKTGQIEVVLYSEVFEQYQPIIKKDQLLIVEGRSREDHYSNSIQIVGEKLYTLDEARNIFGKYLQISYKNAKPEYVNTLKSLFSEYSGGNVAVRIHYTNGNAQASLWLGKAWRIKPYRQLEEQLNALDWIDSVKLFFQ